MGAADAPAAAVLGDAAQVRVRAADDQAEEGRLEVRPGEHRGVDVAPEVVDAGERLAPRRRQALTQADADQQAAHQARAAGYRKEVDIRGLDRRLLEAQVEEVRQ